MVATERQLRTAVGDERPIPQDGGTERAVTIHRLIPLSGVAVLPLLIASLIASGTTPAADASAREVVAFYSGNASGQTLSAVLQSLTALAFIIFASAVVGALRRGDKSYPTSTALAIGGSAVLTVGLTIFAGLTLVLGDVAGKVEPSVLQTLNALDDSMFFPATVGSAAFLLGAGTGVLRSSIAPKWTGWLAIGLGLVAAVPSHVFGGALDHIGFAGFLGLCVWSLLVGPLLAFSDPAV
jgi:hypothetical protein